MMTAMQYYRSLQNGEIILPENSFDSFGFLNIPNLGINSFEINRNTASQTNIPWSGELPNESDVDAFVVPTGPYFTETIYPQKNTNANLILETAANTVDFIFDQFGNNKHACKFKGLAGSVFNINGSLDVSLSKNVPYFAVILLVKGNTTLAASQNIFFISTASNIGRTRVTVNLNADPSTGCLIAGRRISADAPSIISSNENCSNWVVITAIFDYINRELILRVNGVQKAIDTAFSLGANSENTNSLTQYIGGSGATASIAGVTIWNHTPTSFSHIEEVENRYKEFANII